MTKYRTVFLKIALTAVLTGYLLKIAGLGSMYEIVSYGNKVFFFYSCAIVPLFVAIKTFKWHLMARYSGATEGFSTSLSAVLLGLGFSIFTPFRAGEIVRVRYYKSVEKVMLAGLVLVDRVLDLLTILYLTLFFVTGQFSLTASISVFLVISALFSALFGLRGLRLTNGTNSTGAKSGKIYEYLGRLQLGFKILTPMNIVKLCAISLAVWALIMVQFYFIMNIYHLTPFKVVLASLPVIQLSNLFPITIGGIGVRENLSVLVMKVYAIPNQVAAMSAFTLYAIDILIPGMVGVVFFSIKRKQ